jgi:hypothetical protein
MNSDAVALAIRYMRPHKVNNYNKVRLGGTYDGGYVCIDDFENIKLAISGGVAHDDRWENDLARERLIPTLAFDPIEPCDMKSVPRLHYKLFAGKIEAYPLTRNSTLDALLFSYDQHDIIGKIDIEGDEWELFTYTQDNTMMKFRQLVVEFHLNHTLETLVEYGNVFEKLYKYFRVVHIHGNNWCETHSFGSINIPDVFEVTFANLNYYNMTESNEVFPTELDMPCCPEREDISLGTFTL